ncbi:MAG: sigma 54-interacting transcriptional regulator, partial [Desulfobulbaceae bacterium]|nr:sigma 54-interacting transcriptional regulator [Desulfobulbaceae bacterium]
RKDNPFIPVNCGAIPEALLESELFGHTKGSFTGATRNYEGLFRSAHGGTLFLDEIGDTPLSIQVKLLRVLQEKSVRPVGSSQADLIDVRILSATNRDLEDAIAEGNFRQDLYYRLNVVSLEIPSLIQRREDIPLLAAHFLKTISDQTGKKVNGFAPEAMEQLLTAPWPGNVRQLQNSVEHAVALTTTPLISADLLRSTIQEDTGKVPSFSEARKKFEQEYLVNLLMMTKGNVSQAARIAKRNRTDFYKLLQRNHIVPALFKS